MCYLLCTISYRRHRFPAQIIEHTVCLYFLFTRSYRDVEDLMAERGIDVSYETVRRWAIKFGVAYARRLRKQRPKSDGRWHLDGVLVSIGGQQMYLWRAIDSEGEVLDILVQKRGDKHAAAKLMRKLLKRQGIPPHAVITDKLRSYGATLRDLRMMSRHVTGGRASNRAESSCRPVRRRERQMQLFKSGGSRSLSIHATLYNQFSTQRHLISRRTLRAFRTEAMGQWRDATVAA